MCGIAGFAGAGTRETLERMSVAIRRRGPDDDGYYIGPGVGFAFRRLSVIDVAGGHQPISNEDGSVWVMLNGEIYGFTSLREELIQDGHRFVTKSDTEVIVHAYEEWGDECFKKLNGMFAIALWDKKKSRLVLARDRLGKKPLYWTEKNGSIWFASELKALLAAGVVHRELDLVSLGAYFRSDAVPTPRTIFQGVAKLEPASAMAWKQGKVEKTWSFWACPSASSVSTPQEALTGLRETLDVSVRERLVSDVPLGLFLSGGLDSSLVAESAARQFNGTLKAFTIGFHDPSHDERPAARIVAKSLGIELHEEILTEKDALSMLDEAVELLDEPLADPAILPQLLLAKFTRKHVTVALTGDGGDELLLGYQHIPAHIWANRLPHSAQDIARHILRNIPAGSGYFSFGFKAQRFARGLSESDPWARDLAWRGSWLRQDLPLQFDPGFADLQFAARAAEAGDGASFWQKWSWGYLRSYLMDDVLVKVDHATMWHSLEARSPILDPRVVSLLFGLPDHLKLGAWKGKRLFKELLHGRVPDVVLDRPKHGFAVPIAEWLRGPLATQLAEVTSQDFLKSQGLFNAQTVARFISEHTSKKKDRRKELWALLMFQLWYRR
jgi:asparagine synthase (glutamine-hydrolysing)